MNLTHGIGETTQKEMSVVIVNSPSLTLYVIDMIQEWVQLFLYAIDYVYSHIADVTVATVTIIKETTTTVATVGGIWYFSGGILVILNCILVIVKIFKTILR